MNFNAKRLCYVNNRPHFAYITCLFFLYLLADEGPHETSKTMLFQQKKAVNQGLFYPFAVPISNNALFEKLKIFYLLESPKNHMQF